MGGAPYFVMKKFTDKHEKTRQDRFECTFSYVFLTTPKTWVLTSFVWGLIGLVSETDPSKGTSVVGMFLRCQTGKY